MGLMRHADSVKSEIPISSKAIRTPSTGLLGRIQQFSDYDRLQSVFSEFCHFNSISRAILLAPNSDFILPIFSIGFDLTTARRFVLNRNSLAGIFADDVDKQVFTETRKDFFISFFSSREWSSIRSVTVYKISITDSDTLYLVYVSSLLDNERTASDYGINNDIFETFRIKLGKCQDIYPVMVDSFSVVQSRESVESKISGALNTGKQVTLVKVDISRLFSDTPSFMIDFNLQTLHSSILNHISRKVGSSNIINQISISDIRIALFTSQKIDTDFYRSLLTENLEKLFGLSRVSKISISFDDESINSFTQVKKFILGET